MEPLRWVAGAELSTQARNELLPSSLAYGGCAPRDDTLCSLRIQNLPTDGSPSMGLGILSEQMRITTATYSHSQTIHVGKKEKRP